MTFVIFIFSLFSFLFSLPTITELGPRVDLPYHLHVSGLLGQKDKYTLHHVRNLFIDVTMRPNNYFVLFHPDNIHSTDNIYYTVRLGHILNIYLRNFFIKKLKKLYKKKSRTLLAKVPTHGTNVQSPCEKD